MRRAALVVLALSACGARTDLEVPTFEPTPSDDAGSPRCGSLRVGEVLAPYATRRTEGPIAVAREGGFDLVVQVIEDVLEYHVVRLEVRGGALVPGATSALGPDARSVGAAAARGDRLGLCYGSDDLEGPTRFTRTDALDYRGLVRSTVGAEGGDHCTMLVPLGDHWLVGWQDRGPSPFDWSVSEMDDDGRLRGAREGLLSSPRAGARLAAGAVWASVNDVDRSRIVLRVHGDGGTRSSVGVGTGSAAVDRVALGPAAGGAIAVAWLDVARGLGSLRLEADGSALDRAFEPAIAAVTEGPLLGTIATRELVLVGACADVDGPGRLELRERRAGGHEVVLRVERPICPVRPTFASLGDRALLAWQEDARVHAALLSCAP